MKFCQGPECHMHKTKDRLKGMKGSKTYQTRRRSSFYYGNDNFCSTWCQNDWFQLYGRLNMIMDMKIHLADEEIKVRKEIKETESNV